MKIEHVKESRINRTVKKVKKNNNKIPVYKEPYKKSKYPINIEEY